MMFFEQVFSVSNAVFSLINCFSNHISFLVEKKHVSFLKSVANRFAVLISRVIIMRFLPNIPNESQFVHPNDGGMYEIDNAVYPYILNTL